MNLLLDTQITIWLSQGDPRLTKPVIAAFEDPVNTLHFSVASVWEMAIKRSLGKLVLPTDLASLVERFRGERVRVVEISEQHALRVEHLPFHHRDPFDRLLAATCLVEGWTLVSADPAFDAYGVPRIG